jgi:hypothetical protein
MMPHYSISQEYSCWIHIITHLIKKFMWLKLMKKGGASSRTKSPPVATKKIVGFQKIFPNFWSRLQLANKQRLNVS